MDALKYPVGRFDPRAVVAPAARPALLESLANAPARLREAVARLDDAQLDTPYRDGGWTVRQVVHHVPDSHMNAYIRTRLALTEENPTIRPYAEEAWARLADARTMPVDVSLELLDALHARWLVLLRSLDDADWQRTLMHPDLGAMTVANVLGMYEWHGRHHLAHITGLKNRMGWR